ncbi:MAG: vanadium-dependent haloperoxidase [Acidobacteriota bacterium]
MYRPSLACAIVALSAAITGPTIARADAVLDWNVIALKTTAAAPFNPPLETRNLAIVHAAMFDAVNSITREFHPYAVALRAPEWASPEAAAIAAAHAALLHLYADQQSTLDAAYSTSIAHLHDGPEKTRGIDIGNAVALRILTMRASDGAAAAVNAVYRPGERPGDWIPTPPGFLPALDPGWGSVQPFFLRHGSQFRPGPPPALNSTRYTRDFEEIRTIGSIGSVTRTQAQTDLARLWISTAAQNWNPVARQLAIAQGLTLSQKARAFALLNLAGADAFIAAWDAKFAYNQWRPVTAIRAADIDGNPATDAAPGWTPLLVTPPFPDYIAGHTTYAGAAQKVLESVFGRHPGSVITLTSVTAPGVVETYTTFKDMADGVVDARVWGGIHWRTSSVRGRTVGEKIGRYAVDRFLGARDDDDSHDRRP